ncbi:membrane-associated protein, putative [Bodo saltans]|uniref:Membrane-associated protein, putative n=1 Tax=Bodo saltans TaxID=75058 RepID=A0A0S4IXV4_BODSA|nr:membrane-associated protein, putative [Bodo saltans]|eukprot:CUG10246.1 membrane-associated protein, putative [Bodo saltans]
MGRLFSASALCTGFGAIVAFHSVFYVRPDTAALVTPTGGATQAGAASPPTVWREGLHICFPLGYNVVPVDLRRRSKEVQVVVRRSTDGAPGCCTVRITYHVDLDKAHSLHTTYGLASFENTLVVSSTNAVVWEAFHDDKKTLIELKEEHVRPLLAEKKN